MTLCHHSVIRLVLLPVVMVLIGILYDNEVHMVMGFTASLPYRHHRCSSTTTITNPIHQYNNNDHMKLLVSMLILHMVPLSNEEIFARAAITKQQQQQDIPAVMKLYDDDLLQQMQQVLILLDKRAMQGVGSLVTSEIQQLDTYLHNILQEMKLNQHLKINKPLSSSTTTTSTPSSSTTILQPQSTSPPIASSSTNVPTSIMNMNNHANTVATTSPITETTSSNNDAMNSNNNNNNDNNNIYNENDTVNTYIIPNMDRMTPAQYQYELQKSVIERQAVRKQTQVTGNRSSWDYMNQLSGETGVLKKDNNDHDSTDASSS